MTVTEAGDQINLAFDVPGFQPNATNAVWVGDWQTVVEVTGESVVSPLRTQQALGLHWVPGGSCTGQVNQVNRTIDDKVFGTCAFTRH